LLDGVFISVLLPVALGIIMLGLGLSLTVDDFRRVVSQPRAVFVGLVCQMLLLPVVGFAIAMAFRLPPDIAVGLMLLAASPGGATANLYSHLAGGDVALNVTLTGVNSILSLVTLPFIVEFAMRAFLGAEATIPMQPSKMAQVFSVVLVPIAIGMLVARSRPALAARLGSPVKKISAAFLFMVIAGAVAGGVAARPSGDLFKYVGSIAGACVAFNLASMATGYFVPRLLKIPKRQAVAIGMEIGIHNSALAITVATGVLGSSAMAMPAAFYSIVMFITAAIFASLVGRRSPEIALSSSLREPSLEGPTPGSPDRRSLHDRGDAGRRGDGRGVPSATGATAT
jgi:bile acid:Na+ symporter, BASS family